MGRVLLREKESILWRHCLGYADTSASRKLLLESLGILSLGLLPNLFCGLEGGMRGLDGCRKSVTRRRR